ncbi:hypothetical protein EDD17DRAFT_1754663 [Pisolithus thermaeus]|nr:hypothetical protein EDD17DRAFT_1754663 [Pisolithus thermaeus]
MTSDGWIPPPAADDHLQAISAASVSRPAPFSMEIPGYIGNFRAQSAPPYGFPSGRLFRSAPASSAPVDGSPVSTSSLFFGEDSSISPTPTSTPQQLVEERPEHIPRPPNAFLLYRSDFLKRRTIPREVEKRQQNLSRIIGECWNMLSAEEKAVWREKAAAVTAAHQAKYPHYKFRPTRRTAGKRTGKNKRNNNGQHRNDSVTETSSSSIEPSIGPVRGPQAISPSVRMFPYDDGRLSTPKRPSMRSTSVSPFLSPLSLATLLPPFTLQDQLTSVSFLGGNPPQTRAYESLSAPLFNPDNTLSELAPAANHNTGVPDEIQPPSEYFRLDQHHVPHTLGQDCTTSPSLSFTTSPLLSFGESADSSLGTWTSPATFNCPDDGLGPYNATLLSWLPDSSTSTELENPWQVQRNQQL